MKNLYIIRHAKSDWNDPRLDDFDRPLNARGNRDAPVMAERLRVKGVVPDAIVTSTAVRALATATRFAQVLGVPERDVQKSRMIYEATAERLLAVINAVDNGYATVFLVGHNPGLSYLVELLANEGRGNLPTCSVTGISFDVDDWKSVTAGIGTVIFHDYPKNS